jgi:hypothetical protein
MKHLILGFLFLGIVFSTTVSLEHLQIFFNNTYDRNKDGYATI